MAYLSLICMLNIRKVHTVYICVSEVIMLFTLSNIKCCLFKTGYIDIVSSDLFFRVLREALQGCIDCAHNERPVFDLLQPGTGKVIVTGQ
jgi:hypothetical protein